MCREKVPPIRRPERPTLTKLAIGDVTGKVNGTTVTQNWAASSDSLTVGSPDFRINKKFDPILVTGNYPSTMTITLGQPAQSSPINDITFSDSLPEHMLLANPSSPSTGTCGGHAHTGGEPQVLQL